MSEGVAEVREEYFESIPTGVELEVSGGSAEDREESSDFQPWDPDKIRVSTRQFSLRNILDLIDDGDLELAPDFQRNRVWKHVQKSRLIESILLQIPLPAFYFAEDADGAMRVVDGLQRLSTVHSFVRGDGSFPLTDLEYLAECDMLTFDGLPAALRRRLNNTQIVAHVIDPTTPSAVKYDIFRRINTGGTPLNSQEIRHCMAGPRGRDFLKRCCSHPAFQRATAGSVLDHVRMVDREMVLRYIAFSVLTVEGYARVGSMDSFLDEASDLLDDPRRLPDATLDGLFEGFVEAMRISFEIFGEDAFRKYGHGRRNPINRA